MKIVVTGALGHIGSRLLRDLPFSFPGCEILMIDNMMTQRYCSLFNLPKKGKYTFIEKDVRNVDLAKMLQKEDVLVHLAAITDAASSFGREKELEDNNYKGLQHVAKAVAKKKARLIHLSSTSVYGTQKNEVDESCQENELKPQSPYAHFKLMEEKWLKKYRKKTGLRYLTLRFGTIFGVSPGMRFHTAVNKFCWQAAMNQPVTIWKTALHQKRAYLDLDDAVKCIIFVIQKDFFRAKTYNVLTGNYTVADIIRQIQKHMKNFKIVFVRHKIMNQFSYIVDNARIRKEGFAVKGDLHAGIANTIKLILKANQSTKEK
jgi:nucleoside-diphosphate-sugar epimerase